MQTYEVRGNSLTGVLESGDSIILLPLPEKIKRDSLVVFSETPGQQSIKICKGIPGDQMAINSETKEIMVNGTLMPVKFSNDAQVHCWKDWIRFCSKVPEGHLFLMGTQPEGIDSRSRGYFSMKQVLGLAEKVKINTNEVTSIG
jgi:signal peptidase I